MERIEQADALVAHARGIMSNACCAYSGFAVGAALLTARGVVYGGVNVESSSYGATICAERSALAGALSAGERDFVAIAIATDAATPTLPCGICRQLLHDYAPELLVISDASGLRIERSLRELLPEPFGRDDLSGAISP